MSQPLCTILQNDFPLVVNQSGTVKSKRAEMWVGAGRVHIKYGKRGEHFFYENPS